MFPDYNKNRSITSVIESEVSFMDYNDLENKPSINGVTLESDMTLEDVGISEMTPEMVAEIFSEVYGVVL